MEIEEIKKGFKVGRNYDILKKIKEESMTVDDLISRRLLIVHDYTDWGPVIDVKAKLKEAIGHLYEEGRVEVAYNIKKIATLSPDEEDNLRRTAMLMQKKREIRDSVLICLTEMKKEKLIDKRGEVVSLKCSFVENEALKDGNVIDGGNWRVFKKGSEQYSPWQR